MPKTVHRYQPSGWKRRKRERPDEILEAARYELLRRGKNVRMTDIARRAGITKGTIYLYFSGKSDLLRIVNTVQMPE